MPPLRVVRAPGRAKPYAARDQEALDKGTNPAQRLIDVVEGMDARRLRLLVLASAMRDDTTEHEIFTPHQRQLDAEASLAGGQVAWNNVETQEEANERLRKEEEEEWESEVAEKAEADRLDREKRKKEARDQQIEFERIESMRGSVSDRFEEFWEAGLPAQRCEWVKMTGECEADIRRIKDSVRYGTSYETKEWTMITLGDLEAQVGADVEKVMEIAEGVRMALQYALNVAKDDVLKCMTPLEKQRYNASL